MFMDAISYILYVIHKLLFDCSVLSLKADNSNFHLLISTHIAECQGKDSSTSCYCRSYITWSGMDERHLKFYKYFFVSALYCLSEDYM